MDFSFNKSASRKRGDSRVRLYNVSFFMAFNFDVISVCDASYRDCADSTIIRQQLQVVYFSISNAEQTQAEHTLYYHHFEIWEL
jgi:hypothetical protein